MANPCRRVSGTRRRTRATTCQSWSNPATSSTSSSSSTSARSAARSRIGSGSSAAIGTSTPPATVPYRKPHSRWARCPGSKVTRSASRGGTASGQLEVAGRRAHAGLAPQPGQVGDGEAGPVGLGHLDDAEVEQPLAGAVERLGEGAEHEGLVVAQEEAGGRLADQGGPCAGAAHRQVEAGVQLGAVVGAHDVDDELGRVGRERHLAAVGEVGEQPHAGAVGRAQQCDPARAEVVEQDGVGHPAVAEGPDRAAVGVGDGGEGVAVLVGERHPAEAVVAAGEGLPRHPGADPAAAHARARPAGCAAGRGPARRAVGRWRAR